MAPIQLSKMAVIYKVDLKRFIFHGKDLMEMVLN